MAVPDGCIGQIGLGLRLVVAAALTLITGYDYLLTGLRHIAGPTTGKARPGASEDGGQR